MNAIAGINPGDEINGIVLTSSVTKSRKKWKTHMKIQSNFKLAGQFVGVFSKAVRQVQSSGST